MQVDWGEFDKVVRNGQVRVLHPTADQLDTAFDLLRRRRGKSYSFVDAASSVITRDESIHTAFSLDRHFAQDGFVVVPVPEKCLHEPLQAYLAAPTSAGDED